MSCYRNRHEDKKRHPNSIPGIFMSSLNAVGPSMPAPRSDGSNRVATSPPARAPLLVLHLRIDGFRIEGLANIARLSHLVLRGADLRYGHRGILHPFLPLELPPQDLHP